MIKWIISSSCLILIMAAVRRLFKRKISPRLQYALWLLVAIRLIVPVNLGNSVLSIENFTNQLTEQQQKEETMPNPVVHDKNNDSADRIKVFDSIETMNMNEDTEFRLEEYHAVPKEDTASAKPTEKLKVSEIFFVIWVIGAGCVAVVFVISNAVFGKRVKNTRILLEKQNEKLPVYESSAVETPCLFGMVHPGIYVTNAVVRDEKTLRHAVAHELTHYGQGDLWWSLIRCLCLTLHWYNPLVWWAAKLSKQDGELACDEATIQKLGEDERLAYGKTLIRLTCEKRQDLFIAATTMTSDKKSITERIQRIAKRRKLTIYVLIGVLLISMIAVGCTFTGAKGAKDKEETDASESAVLRGVPCEDPEEEGWNLSLAEDVRDNFNRMSPQLEEGSVDAVYLLGETSKHGYLLYGKGDYQTMLVYMDGKYAEINFPYASNYMELPRLIEKDIDRDGEMELCIIVWVQHGTGLHIENLLLADFNEEEKLYVYEFVPESYTEQLQKGLSYEITKEGIQPFVDGQVAGRMEPHLEDMEPFDGASVGNNMRFDCDPLTGEVRLRGGIMLLIEEHPGGLFGNANDVTAKVCWDGEKFSLKNFTSNNWWLEEEITYALQKQYGVENFYSIKMKYDSTKMNQNTLVVTADILPEWTDSLADHVEVHLRKSVDPSSNSGWEIEEIYCGVASKAEQIIEKANVNLREGYENAKLTYVDNAEVGWDHYSDNPWSTEAERDALAQTALKELYTLTGYNVTECTYTTDGRSRFIFGKNGDYIRKSIAFYSRDYGFSLCGDSVPYQGFMNARKFHYSDVQQLESPYGKAEYSGHAGYPTWYLKHSGVYQGEYITGYEAINLDDIVYTHVKLTFDGGYYIVVMDEAIESVSEIMGPYYQVEEDTGTESENASGHMIINNRSYETVIWDEVYRQAMTEFLETGVFPATEGNQCNGDPFDARYAVQDIDGDGREELLLSFPDAETIAGMTYYIYDYDITTRRLYVQNSGYPDFTIYDNGYIKQDMSHNHGRSNLDDFWPYFLYYYNPEADFYEYIASVDARQKREDIGQDPPFPKDKDLNGDGVVYYDNMAQTYDNPEGIMDNEEYEKWCAKYNRGNEIQIQWYLASGTESAASENTYPMYYEVPRKDQVCLAVMPAGISKAGGDYRYLIPENQEEWIDAYQAMCAYAHGNGRWQENERSMGIWIVYNDEWTAMTDQGFLVNFERRTEKSNASEFYELCLNEAKKQKIEEPLRPEEIKNIKSVTLHYGGDYVLADQKNVFEIQKAFSSSKEIRGGTACPFTASLSLNYENGEERTIYLATDSCDTWLSSGVYYEYSGFEDIEKLKDYFHENGTNLNAPICSFGDGIAVKNHEILSDYAFQWISWEDVSEVIGTDYEEQISGEGGNGRMFYRTADGITYILTQNREGASVNQIAGVLITDEKYQLGCGFSVGMKKADLESGNLPFLRYEKDLDGSGLTTITGGSIALYNGMENLKFLEYDYAYSWDEGYVLDIEEQKERLQELGLSEDLCSETHFILIAFVKNEIVSGIFMGIIP